MMILKGAAAALSGLSGGLAVSGGIFAFLTMIGIFPRILSVAKTTGHIYLVESMIILGGSLGNIIYIFGIKLSLGIVGLAVYGLFAGVYVGCLAMALAEELRVIPIIVKRIRFDYGLSWLVAGLAVGKAVGSYIQLVYFSK